MVGSVNGVRRGLFLTARCLTVVLCTVFFVVLLSPASARALIHFTDVESNAWYVQDGSLDYVVERGLMSGGRNPDGSPTGLFDPDGTLVRGQVATILFRYANPHSDATTNPSNYATTSSFLDVAVNYYYTAAVEWCFQNGIITGYVSNGAPSGYFGPEDYVTRAQLATMVYRFAKHLGVDMAYDPAAFYSTPDYASVPDYAVDAMGWCADRGIITGSIDPQTGIAYLRPDERATRAQMAKIITVLVRDVVEAEGVPSALLYADGDLVFQLGMVPEPGRELVDSWTGFIDGTWNWDDTWMSLAPLVTKVTVVDEMAPVSMEAWFRGMTNCTSMDLSKLDTSGVSNFAQTFMNCRSLEQLDLGNFDTSSALTMFQMFSGCSNLRSLDVSGFDTKRVTDFRHAFSSCAALGELNLGDFDTSSAVVMDSMFAGCSSLPLLDVAGFETSGVTSFGSMFSNCSNLRYLDVSGFETGDSTNFAFMFYGCSLLGALDVSAFDMSAAVTLDSMFARCSSLTGVGLGPWVLTGAKTLSSLFSGCTSLASIDLSGWSVSGVGNMSRMFYDCTALESANLNGIDASGVTNFSQMFANCAKLVDLDLGGFVTAAGVNYSRMFAGCSSLPALDLSGFNTLAASQMDSMFFGMNNLAEVTLGTGFSFVGNGTAGYCVLPTPNPAYIADANGLWVNALGQYYVPADVPNGVADVYRAATGMVPARIGAVHVNAPAVEDGRDPVVEGDALLEESLEGAEGADEPAVDDGSTDDDGHTVDGEPVVDNAPETRGESADGDDPVDDDLLGDDPMDVDGPAVDDDLAGNGPEGDDPAGIDPADGDGPADDDLAEKGGPTDSASLDEGGQALDPQAPSSETPVEADPALEDFSTDEPVANEVSAGPEEEAVAEGLETADPAADEVRCHEDVCASPGIFDELSITADCVAVEP